MHKLKEIFEDVNGRLSSKRVIGVIGVITCVVLIINASYSMIANKEYTTNNNLIQWVLTTFAGLLFGGSAVEFLSKK